MKTDFSSSDLITLATLIEINGMDFYSGVAQKVKHKDARTMFNYLANEEERHATTFRRMQPWSKKPAPQVAQPIGILEIMAKDHVFAEKSAGKKVARSVKNEKQALEIGIQFEEQSITFYEAMKAYVPESEHFVINAILQAEHEHKIKLKELQARL